MADNNSAAAPPAANSNQATNSNRGSSSQGFRGRGGGGWRGNRGGRGGTNRPQRGRGDVRKGPNPRGADRKRDMGRGDYQRNHVDRRTRIEETQASKRQKMDDGEAAHVEVEGTEVQGEARKPKRKVAVMVGYAGTGYKGMQINSAEKTIEGELFKAFVAAGAISKANADDPKKSSLVRCARTDKGVHAAGNVISLKLIVEDPNTVQNINEHLPSQIRVWGIERTNGSFSCYQTCDSRWYEYLIPTYSFLPPHPESYLGRELVQAAEKEGVYESYQARQEDVATFWDEAHKKYVEPILEKLDPDMRAAVMAAVLKPEEDGNSKKSKPEGPKVEESKIDAIVQSESDQPETTDHQEEVVSASEVDQVETAKTENGNSIMKTEHAEPKTDNAQEDNLENTDPDEATTENVQGEVTVDNESKEVPIKNELDEVSIKPEATESAASKSILTPLEAAIKEVKAAMITAKKAYRISPSRRQAVQDALNVYLGTRNFHNYTIQKAHADPSAKRVIRSFKVHKDPIIINDTEWLSLKVHGQSFMMHQIRKMVAMVALVVRCGSGTGIMIDSYGPANISIPKAPSLGLLLEKPVFETYNERAQREFNREKIDFDNYEKEIDEFKQREIYDRIFREEEKDHQFHTFFNHIDHYRSDYFLWVTASGLKAAAQNKTEKKEDDDSDNEADANGEEG